LKYRLIKTRIVPVIFWILVWQIAAMAVNRSLLIPIPTPITTVRSFAGMFTEPAYLTAAVFSVIRILIGFICALAAGTLLAALCVRFKIFGIMVSPLLQIIRAIPVASFTILIFLWVSRGKIPSAISFFTVLPIVWANIETGLREFDKELLEMARVFGMKSGTVFKEILLPGIRPFFSASVTSGIGFAWKSGIAAEVICRTQNSLGNLLWAGKSSVDYDRVFALTLLIIILSIAIQYAAKKLFGKGGRK